MKKGKKLDPVTFEILRHRLEEIVHEAYYTMARVSGKRSDHGRPVTTRVDPRRHGQHGDGGRRYR